MQKNKIIKMYLFITKVRKKYQTHNLKFFVIGHSYFKMCVCCPNYSQ